MMPISETPPTNPGICLTSGNNLARIPIQQQDISDVHKMLGVWMTPTGSEAAQTEYLCQVANQILSLVATSHFSQFKAFMAYMACWSPAVGYALSASTLSEKDLETVQTRSLSIILPKLGFNRHFPQAVIFGPDMGDMQL